MSASFDRMFGETSRVLGLQADARSQLRITDSANLPSCFPVTDLAVASIGVAGLAAAELVASAGHKRPTVTVDRYLASAWFRWSLRPVGWQVPAPWGAIAGDYKTADGWIRLHTNAPHHQAAALAVLDCSGTREAVATAVAGWNADDLESEILGAAGCAARMRTLDAWRAHPQGRAIAVEPLIAFTRTEIGAPPSWQPGPGRPLAGIKVLDLTRVLAGPVATRFLAGLGATVLRIDPPSWDEPAVVPDVTLGKSCARLDLHRADDRKTLERLLGEADILVHGYRPGALDGLGYSEAARRTINPRIVDVSLCAYGWSGPWAGRRGFDSLVQMSSGIADAGMAWTQADCPTPLPVQALDHATGYLLAAAALRGLLARQNEGVALTAKLSLARTAALLIGDGIDPQEPVWRDAADADYAASLEQTVWGPAHRLRPPLAIGETTLRWDKPASPLGSAAATW